MAFKLKDDVGIFAKISRPLIEDTIDEVVDTFWGKDKNFKTLLKETAAHEAHFGELDENNIMQVVPVQEERLREAKFRPQLGAMGVFPDPKTGKFNLKDPRTNVILAAMTYVTKEPGINVPSTSSKERYEQYKKLYN